MAAATKQRTGGKTSETTLAELQIQDAALAARIETFQHTITWAKEQLQTLTDERKEHRLRMNEARQAAKAGRTANGSRGRRNDEETE